MTEYKFISIVDKNPDTVHNFVKELESISKDKLTGMSLVVLNDNTIFLGLTFTDDVLHKQYLEKSRKIFEKVKEEEENYSELVMMSKFAFLGNYNTELLNLPNVLKGEKCNTI